MPYFTWQGVNILGETKKGKSFVRSEKELDALLISRDIALLRSKKSPAAFFVGPITLALKIRFFRQLSILLKSGILLPEALVSVAQQIDHVSLQEMVYHMADQVCIGMPLSDILLLYPAHFDRFIIHLVYVGQETGTLPQVFTRLCHHLEVMHSFKKKIRDALTLPCITFFFFCLIATGVVVFVVPRFSTLFLSSHCELPYLTQLLIRVSNFLQSRTVIVLGVVLIPLFCIVQSFCRSRFGSRVLDKIILSIPFLKNMIHDNARVAWLESLACLVHAGVQVFPALRIAKKSISNGVLRDYVDYLAFSVGAGASLSTACEQHPHQWFDQHVIAMIRVGEASGKLGDSLSYAADEHREKVQRKLNFIATIIQPLLIVTLGFFIALFIFAIYLPVFNLAQIAG